jgi:Domain of unknown function (DUF362)
MFFPEIYRVRQIQPLPTIEDLPASVRQAWRQSKVAARIRPGMRVAVGVGSRGIRHIAEIVKATIEALGELGAKPFIVAAMGSHGGATPDGQRELLASYGIDESSMGVPVMTDMETTNVGVNSWGEPVWWDSNACRADGVVTVSRVKPHTDYHGPFESGVLKMTVIGLGKRDGANQHHRWGWKGLQQMMPESARVIAEATNFWGGLAILENAHEETAHLEVIDKADLFDVEPILLERARTMIGTIPFEELDVLAIGEIGKNYSGCGIDPNVIGRFLVEAAPEMETARPRVTRLIALDLSPESHGNGTGTGLADLITDRMVRQIDANVTRINSITACFLWRAKLPFACPTDRDVFRTAIETCWQPIPERLKMAIIPNSLEVDELWVTRALADIARTNPNLNVSPEPIAIPFDPEGNLRQEELFPRSTRGRRRTGFH